MPGGRPTKYEAAFCEAVRGFGKEGYSKAEIASALDVTRPTLDEWAKIHAEFSYALDEAREHSLAWWEGKARTNLATQGFQSGLWKQAVSGRFPAEPYRERSEVSGPDGGPVVFQKLIDEIIDPAE
jgi:hypothetical protein